jgi:predicted deacylase
MDEEESGASTSDATGDEAVSIEPENKQNAAKSASSSTSKTRKKSPKRKPKTPVKRKVRLAHELSLKRRRIIRAAMEDHKAEHKDEWDRSAGVKTHTLMRKRIKPGTMRSFSIPLLETNLGESWNIPVTVINGSRPGPTVTISAGIHGDELTGPSACSHLLSSAMTDPGRSLDPQHVAGIIRILPIINIPGYRNMQRDFPDGRDLNREFPGRAKGSTTSRVAYRVWNDLIVGSDYIVDLHSAAKGRSNMPQVRTYLSDAHSNIIAKAFGIEVILDSKPPRGSLRRVAMENGIGVVTYEGGGADSLDQEAVQVAVNGVLNVLRTLHVIPGNPTRPKFRLLASGSSWLRASEGGLLDMYVEPSSVVQKGDVVAKITDPGTPGLAVDIVAPKDGLLICTATNPFVTAGNPVGHFLPLEKHLDLVLGQCDEESRFIVAGSEEEPVWREEDIDEISLEGEWSGGSVDAEWRTEWLGSNGNNGKEDEAADANELLTKSIKMPITPATPETVEATTTSKKGTKTAKPAAKTTTKATTKPATPKD